MFKYKKYNPKIELIVKAPRRDRKTLEKVEREDIDEYAAKYGDKLINKRDNPLMTKKKVKFKVEMENETQLCA